jgi:uncharacterized protein
LADINNIENHWRHRVHVEHHEVNGRVNRLLAFLESDASRTVAKAERLRLLTQLDIMRQYRDILWERIQADFQ